MIINFSDLEPISMRPQIVIFGSGAAGISTALSLEQKGIPSLIIEGGGEFYSERSQDLYDGSMSGERILPNGLTGLRQRYFGGSTNCWAGGCLEFDEEDFLERTWVPYSGWPITKQSLLPYYERATRLLNVNQETMRETEKLSDAAALTGFEKRSLTYCKNINFYEVFGEHLRKSRLITVCLNSNLVALKQVNDEIAHATISDYSNNTKLISAGLFVLACGGLENARLLLNFARNEHAQAFSNNFNIGRFFCEHPIAPVATVTNTKKLDLTAIQADNFWDQGYMPYYTVPLETQLREKTLNYAVQFHQQENEFSDADLAAIKLYRRFSKISNQKLTYDEVKSIALNPIDVISTFYEKKKGIRNRLALRVQIEQAPNPDSRILLSDTTDPIGLQRINLAWNFTELDLKTIKFAMLNSAKALWRAGYGTLKIDRNFMENFDELPRDLRGGGHHCGTTRMGINQQTSVVDTDLLFHELKNLYVVGSSVFPTNSWANPTFTIVALAIRLSDMLERRLLE